MEDPFGIFLAQSLTDVQARIRFKRINHMNLSHLPCQAAIVVVWGLRSTTAWPQHLGFVVDDWYYPAIPVRLQSISFNKGVWVQKKIWDVWRDAWGLWFFCVSHHFGSHQVSVVWGSWNAWTSSFSKLSRISQKAVNILDVIEEICELQHRRTWYLKASQRFIYNTQGLGAFDMIQICLNMSSLVIS